MELFEEVAEVAEVAEAAVVAVEAKKKLEVQNRFDQNDPNHSRPRRQCKDRSSCTTLEEMMEGPQRRV
jgi:hypothetical protein